MIQFSKRLATLDKMLGTFFSYDGDAPPIDAVQDAAVNRSLADAFRKLLWMPDNAFRFAWLRGQCAGRTKRAAGGDPYVSVLLRWEQDLIDSEFGGKTT
jgi:hypothetical protein